MKRKDWTWRLWQMSGLLLSAVTVASCGLSPPAAPPSSSSAKAEEQYAASSGPVSAQESQSKTEEVETEAKASPPAEAGKPSDAEPPPAADPDSPTYPTGTADHSPEDGDAMAPVKQRNLPQGFVYLDEEIPGALFDLRYYTEDNFVGAKIDGYAAPVPIASAAAAKALKAVQEDLEPQGLVLLIYDAYRPRKAVEHFKRWAKDPEDDAMKAEYYPEVDKANVFKLGFVASKSGHSRGSTIDLTLADAGTGLALDMGSPFDFFGDVSSHGAQGITAEQSANRNLLKNAMVKRGFKPYNKEWWHYTLKEEPFPAKYFDFDIE